MGISDLPDIYTQHPSWAQGPKPESLRAEDVIKAKGIMLQIFLFRISPKIPSFTSIYACNFKRMFY